jgi:nucleoside-diphosphate-sugar epimerase
MSNILVTGANGFVGRALCRTLRQQGHLVRAAVRRDPDLDQIAVGNLERSTDWGAALAGCDCVIHLAARVHVMSDSDSDPLRAYREINVDASVNLARQAVAAGVKRMVFVSSVKVNGEATWATPFQAADTPRPADPYGVSKLEAETALLQIGRDSGLEVVVVRPPLVYGPGVKANFLNLLKLVDKGIPLPFGSVRNRRSMVALENLVDLLSLCSSHPQAPGQVFLVSDGADPTLAELVGMLAGALGKRDPAFPFPVGLMAAGARLVGKSSVADRLFGSLQVDISQTKARLQWSPLVTPQMAIDSTVADFLQLKRSTKQ